MSKAAEELARGAAREALGPLLDAACARLGAVVKRAYDIAADQAQHQRGAGEQEWLQDSETSAGLEWQDCGCCVQTCSIFSTPCVLLCSTEYERLRPYVAFHAALRSAFQAFVAGLEERCKGIVRHHLETATSEYAMGLLAGKQTIHVLDDMVAAAERQFSSSPELQTRQARLLPSSPSFYLHATRLQSLPHQTTCPRCMMPARVRRPWAPMRTSQDRWAVHLLPRRSRSAWCCCLPRQLAALGAGCSPAATAALRAVAISLTCYLVVPLCRRCLRRPALMCSP